MLKSSERGLGPTTLELFGWVLILLFVVLSWRVLVDGLTLGCVAGLKVSLLALGLITLLSGFARCWVRTTLALALFLILLLNCFHVEDECSMQRSVGEALPFAEPLQVVQPDEPNQIQSNQSPHQSGVDDQPKDRKTGDQSNVVGFIENGLNALRRISSTVFNWFREVRDSQADEVDRLNEAGFTMVDGLKRVSLEKALAAPKRYLDCEQGGTFTAARAKYSVYLGEAAMFELNSAELGPKAQSRLQKLGKLISEAGDKPYVVAGHADRSGNAVNNYYLSQDRATAVASWLVDGGFSDIKKLTIRGEGDRIPIIPVDTAEATNRRVEIRVDCDRLNARSLGR